MTIGVFDEIWIPGEQSIWRFVEPQDNREEWEKFVFPRGITSGNRAVEYSLGRDRIFQRAVEVLRYEIRVFIVRADSAFRSKRPPFEVIICPFAVADKIRSEIDPEPAPSAFVTLVRKTPEPSLIVADGYATINVWAIHKYVAQHVTEPNDFVKLDSAAKIWNGLTGNIKSTIYDWMGRGPVFTPVRPVTRRDPAGCELDLADLVVIGVCHGLISHGLRYTDFQGPRPAQRMGAVRC
ncbi:MAG: hypothetical protein WBG50_10100 [Desulfomonilaceae bacterium]